MEESSHEAAAGESPGAESMCIPPCLHTEQGMLMHTYTAPWAVIMESRVDACIDWHGCICSKCFSNQL